MENNEFFMDYDKNVALLRNLLRAEESFDIIERHLTVCGADACFFTSTDL